MQTTISSSPLVLSILIFIFEQCSAAQLSVGVQHDMSAPTYGLQGPTQSLISYDDKNGLKLGGTINDIFGPPVKMFNGLGNMFQGSNMAGIGNSLKSGSALLGIDAKLLEAAGGAHLFKGGLLMGGSQAQDNIASQTSDSSKRISSIIEMPVKVVAMRDLAEGKSLAEMAMKTNADAQAANIRGENMVKQGQQMKTQGMNQVLQGAHEGMQNLGNMVQQASGNAATAFKLLPIIFDLPTGQEQQQQHVEQQATKTSGQQSLGSGGLLGGGGHVNSAGSLFGGLTSLFPGLNTDPSGAQHSSFGNLFTGQGSGHHNGYAAVLNSTNPFANLLLSPGQGVNPFILPLNNLAQGPLGQSLSSKAPGSGSLLGGQTSYNYNWFPGVKMTETSSSYLPNMLQPPHHLPQVHEKGKPEQQTLQHPQQQEKGQQQVEVQPQQQLSTSPKV